MKRNRILLFLLIVLVIWTAPTFAQGDNPPDPTPTIEVIATDVSETDTAPSAPPIAVDSIIVFALMGVFGGLGLGMTALVAYLTKLLGNSVQTKQLEGLLTSVQRWAYQQALNAAARTPYGWDDSFVKIGGSMLGYPPEEQSPDNPPTSKPVPLPRGIPLNRNYTLDAIGDNNLSFYEETHDGRKVAIPHGYQYRAQPGMIGSSRSPHPDIFYKQAAGFEASIAYKAGRFGYSFTIPDNFVLGARQRFAIVVGYEANYAPMVGTDGNPTLYLDGILTPNSQPVIMLPSQVVIDGQGEAQWVLQTDEEVRNLVVTVGMYIPWAVIGDNSTLTIKSIKFVPVADDYGDAVIAV